MKRAPRRANFKILPFPSDADRSRSLLDQTRTRSWSQWKNPHCVFRGDSFFSLSLAFFFYFIFLPWRKKREGGWKNFSTRGAFRQSRGFCLGTKRGLGGFVRVLFVEVELSKGGCSPSLWWKQSVVFGKLLALCTSSVSVVEDFFSQGFFFSRSSWP